MKTNVNYLFSKMIKIKKKTYFFDIKKSKNGTKCLTIAEKSKNWQNSLVLKEDEMEIFLNTLSELKLILSDS